MTDNQAAAAAAFDSTVLTGEAMPENAISDAAFNAPVEEAAPVPEVKPEAPKPVSTRDAIEKALEETEAKDKKPVEAEPTKADDVKTAKPVEAKAETGAAEKPASEREESEPRQSESRRENEPPARFMPEARRLWLSAPNPVKTEVHRVIEEYEREVSEHRQFREELREYEDLSKQHGVTIKDTMARYVTADRALNQNFGQGVAQLSQQYGKNPAQAIAEVISGFGITPQQYIQAIQQNPQLAMAPRSMPQQQQAPQPVQQQQQINPQQIKEQIRAEMSAETAVSSFASAHPDFGSLSGQIKGILDSGVVDKLYGTGLTLEQKLAEAYRMAGGSNAPLSFTSPVTPVTSESDAKPAPSDAGTKSIRGAPAAGNDTQTRRFKNNRDAAAAALADFGI